MKSEIIQNIKSLPVIPESVRKIQEVCSDARSSIADVVKIVEKDPILTASLLRAANSPLYGFAREVNTIPQAISLFGMSTIKGFAIVTVIKSRFKIDLSPYSLSDKDFLRTAELQNAFMVRWISKSNRTLLDLLAPASFLLEMGVVILSNVLIQKHEQEMFQKKLQKRLAKPIAEIERDVFGMSSYEAAAELFEYWNFDKSLVAMMRNIQTPEKVAKNLRRHAYALSTVQSLISLYDAFSDEQIQNATKLAKAGHFQEHLFVSALNDFQEILQ